MTSTRVYQQTLALMLPVTCLLAASAAAQSTWVGTTSNDWATASNWIPGIPAEGADIAIADATTNGLTLDTSHAIGSFTFGTTGTRTSGFTLQTNAANTLTLGGGIVANGAFTGVGPTLRGHFIVSADQTWDVAGASGIFSDDRGVVLRGVNDTAAAVPSGSLALNGNVTKIDTGAVMFLGLDITGSGNLVIDQGALKLNAGGNQPLIVGGSGNITVNNAASLYLARNSGTFDVTRPLVFNDTAALSIGNGSNTTIASNIAWNGSANTLNVNSTYTFSGAWTGSGTVNKTGNSVLTLTGANNAFAGTLNLDAGRVTFNNAFGGDVNLSATGQLAGESVLSGNLALNGGNLFIDAQSPGALASTGSLTLTGTTTVNLLTTPSVGADILVLTYGGPLSGGLGNLAVPAGYRTPVFSEPVAGEIHLNVGNASRTWNGGAAWDIGTSANWLEGDNLYHQADAVTFGDTGFGTIALTGNLAPASISINNSEFNDYLFTAAAGNLISGSTGITKSGGGAATLQGVNTFTGDIQIDGGTLKPGGNQALGANGRTITVAAGAVLDTNGAMNANRDYNLIIGGDGTGTGAVINTGGNHSNGFRSITLTGDATIGGSGRWDVRPITAGTALLDLGGHTLTKTGTNFIAFVDGTVAEDGTIDIDGGTFAFTRSNVSGSGSVNINNGAQMLLENYTSGSFAKAIAIDGSTLRNAGASPTLDAHVSLSGEAKISVASGNSLTVPNPITGGGNLEKLEAGSLVLTGDNTYSGSTKIGAGVIQLGNGGNGGSINTNPIELASTAAGIRINRSDDFTFTNVITGSGITGNALNPAAFNKDGPNTVTLVAANTFTGTTRHGGGFLAIGSDESVFGDPGALIDLRTAGTGGIHSTDASPRTIPNPISYSESAIWGSPGTGKLTLTGDVAYGGGSKAIIVNNDEVEFSGVISGTGVGTELAKEGPGTLVFTGDNTYTQNTVISQGVLQVGNGGTTGSLGFSPVTNNASLVIDRSLPEEVPNWSVSNLISGTGSLTHAGPAFTIVSADNTYTGDTIVSDGTVSVDNPYFADDSAIRVSGDGSIELFHGQTDTVGTFYIDGVAQAAGLWGRPGAIAELGADFESAALSGDGLLSVTGSGDPYSEWAADNGLTAGVNDDPADNPDMDGLDNLGEFALDDNPLSGAASGKVAVKVATVGGQPVLTLTLPVRTAVGTFSGDDALTAGGDGVTYTIEGSDTLAAWLLDVDEVTGPDATAIQAGLPALSSGDWVYRTFRSPGTVTGDPAEFLRARIE